tara:strand:- start:785 stop:910 length:126 start_codon:yes stop_codon:yes gene_type:complete
MFLLILLFVFLGMWLVGRGSDDLQIPLFNNLEREKTVFEGK